MIMLINVWLFNWNCETADVRGMSEWKVNHSLLDDHERCFSDREYVLFYGSCFVNDLV
jgi:hypothetical protein